MPSPERRDSSWAYAAMNRWVALEPAYPPLAGDPLIAAPQVSPGYAPPGAGAPAPDSWGRPNAVTGPGSRKTTIRAIPVATAPGYLISISTLGADGGTAAASVPNRHIDRFTVTW